MTSALVVGAGLIGTSVGLALRSAGWTVHLDDADPQRVELGVDMGAGAHHAGEPVDVLVAAVPPRHVAAVVVEAMRQDLARTYTDVASVKARPAAAIDAEGAHPTRYVGGHPVAGRERSGPAGARHDLFAGRPWVLTPAATTEAGAVSDVRLLVEACGGVPVTMAADEHDRALAAVSHTPQLVASALAAGLLDLPDDAVAIAGQGLRDMVRIAASEVELWADIAIGNAEPLAAALATTGQRLTRAAAALASAADDPAAAEDAVRRLLQAGRDGHDRLPGKHGGRAGPTFETVVVVLADRPGELARLLQDAGQSGVNVEDLRVEHTPGRPTGIVELYVRQSGAPLLRTTLRRLGWPAH